MRGLAIALTALCAALSLPSPAGAGGGVSEALNWARQMGCGAASARQGARAPLRESVRLREVAARLADGDSLKRALARLSYQAQRTSALHLSGVASDGEVAGALSGRYCATVADAQFREFGVQRRAGEIWIVLAAPIELPSVADAASVDRQILALINAARARGRTCGAKYYPPVPPLAWSEALRDAALEHSRSMARYDEFEHRGHDGSTPSMRVERAGYAARVVGENIAAGAMSPAEAAAGWLASAPHCENIMDPRFTETGIGYAVNTASRWSAFWTEEFGAPAAGRIRSANR